MLRFRRTLLLALAPILLLGFGLTLFPSAGRDDAHIGYWVAQGLSNTGRIINYNGEALEQSSTLLHPLLLALTHKLCGGQVGMVILGRVSAIVFGIGAVLLSQQLAARVDRRLATAAGLLTASSAYFIYWSFGGMEATLCALLGLWLVLTFGDYLGAPNERLCNRRLLWASLAILAFALARPEEPLVLFCIFSGAGGLVFLRARSRAEPADRAALGRIALLALIGLLIVIAVFVWRWKMFGSFFPQPVSAKSGSLSARTIKAGLRYFSKNLIREHSVILFAATVLLGMFFVLRDHFRRQRLAPHLLFAVVFLASYGAFVIFAGGDWMEAGRFFVPLLPIAAIFAALAIWRLLESHIRLGVAFALLLGLLQIATIVRIAARDSVGLPWGSTVVTEPYAMASHAMEFSWFERHNRANLRDIPTILRLDEIVKQLCARRNSGDPIRIMSAQLGMVAYHVVGRHFGEVEILDRRGLVDRRFTSCPKLAPLRRTAGGLQLDYDFYFAHRNELESECGIPRPELIFDIGEVPVMTDYTVVYRQRGEVRIDSKWFPGRPFRADQFIAVRNDLAGELHQRVE